MCLAIPGKILSLTDAEPLERMGRVSFGGIIKEVSLAYVPEAKLGDYVIVHVGFAISTLDEAEANRVFEYLHQMDELGELMIESKSSIKNSDRESPEKSDSTAESAESAEFSL